MDSEAQGNKHWHYCPLCNNELIDLYFGNKKITCSFCSKNLRMSLNELHDCFYTEENE